MTFDARPDGALVQLGDLRVKKMDASLLMFERLGVFADWKLPTDDDLRFVAESLKFNDIVFGIGRDRDRIGWKPEIAASKVIERIGAARQAGLEPVVMTWAKRDILAIDEMCEYILEVTDENTASLLDAEEEWYEGFGIKSETAAERVAEKLEDRYWGVSGIGGLHKSVLAIAKLAKYNVPQCYSFYKPVREKHWSHSRATFPGPQQDQGAERWRAINPEAQLIMGNGVYWAERPASGLTPALGASHIMRFSLIETLSLGILMTWFWSLKWFREANKRGEEVRQFFGA